MKIDPLRSLEKVDAAIAADANPRHRAMLENFREHLLAELEGDVDRIMKTQVAEPRYQFWGSGIGDFGPKGGEQVRGFYRHIFEQGYNKLYYEIDRIFCGDDHLFHDGVLHMIWPGRALRAIGVQVDDPDAQYLDPREVEAMLPTTGFAGSPAELRAMLRRIEDVGAEEVVLVPTTSDPDEVSRVADCLG